MKKLVLDPNFKPTELPNTPRIGWDDPYAVEKTCQECSGLIAVEGRIYCVSGVNWCQCPPKKITSEEIEAAFKFLDEHFAAKGKK